MRQVDTCRSAEYAAEQVEDKEEAAVTNHPRKFLLPKSICFHFTVDLLII